MKVPVQENRIKQALSSTSERRLMIFRLLSSVSLFNIVLHDNGLTGFLQAAFYQPLKKKVGERKKKEKKEK